MHIIPVYRQFMAKDSFSPFKKINGYGFGDNNPIMNTDPTGHFPRWMGYAMGAMSIGMSIVMAVLLPVAGAAISGTPIISVTEVLGTIGIMSAGIASGSLQIAATKHPQNMTLQKVSNGFGIAEGIAAMATGAVAIGEGIAGAVTMAGTITKTTSALLITSGITGAAAGVTGGAASGISEAMAFDSRLAEKSGLQSAVTYLGYISMGLMAVSIISGTGAMGKTELGNKEEIDAKIKLWRAKKAFNNDRSSLKELKTNLVKEVASIYMYSNKNQVFSHELELERNMPFLIEEIDEYYTPKKTFISEKNIIFRAELRQSAVNFTSKIETRVHGDPVADQAILELETAYLNHLSNKENITDAYTEAHIGLAKLRK